MGGRGALLCFSRAVHVWSFLATCIPQLLVLFEIPTRLALFEVRLDAQIVRGQKRDCCFVTPSHFELGASMLELVGWPACDMLIITSKWFSTGSCCGIPFLGAITMKRSTLLGLVLVQRINCRG